MPNAIIKDQEPPNWATASAIRSQANQLLRGVKLPPEHGHHVQAGVGFTLQQDANIVAVDLHANGLFERRRIRLMRRLVQHGREAEKFAARRLVHQHVLMILVDGRDPDLAGDHDISLAARIAHLINTLARREGLQFDLPRQNRHFFIVQ
jgi:hypothetical protein